MLGSGDDTILKNQIASVDPTGAPIHANASTADSLATILTRMAENRLIGSTLTHGGDAGEPQMVVDLMPVLHNFEFEIGPFELQLDRDQKNYQVTLDYWDSHQNKVTLNGALHWLD